MIIHRLIHNELCLSIGLFTPCEVLRTYSQALGNT